MEKDEFYTPQDLTQIQDHKRKYIHSIAAGFDNTAVVQEEKDFKQKKNNFLNV